MIQFSDLTVNILRRSKRRFKDSLETSSDVYGVKTQGIGSRVKNGVPAKQSIIELGFKRSNVDRRFNRTINPFKGVCPVLSLQGERCFVFF